MRDAGDTLLALYPESEAPELVSRRTPRLYPVWQKGISGEGPIPDSVLEVLERPGLARLAPVGSAVGDTTVAVLAFFRPRIRGDSVFLAADWLFPTRTNFFGQEYELVYVCRGTSCTRVRFTHTGVLN